jgi:hypothetical protein
MPKGKTLELLAINPTVSIDLLRNYVDGYELEPGVEYDDVEVVVLRKGIIVDVEAEIGFDDGSTIDVHRLATIE